MSGTVGLPCIILCVNSFDFARISLFSFLSLNFHGFSIWEWLNKRTDLSADIKQDGEKQQ